jgi:hypothetical protein
MVKKNSQLFSYCGYFDHPDLQSLNECIFVFWFTKWKLKNLGDFNITSPPPNFKIAIGKPNKQICSRLVTADQGGQKNHNGKTTTIFFTMFSTSNVSPLMD